MLGRVLVFTLHMFEPLRLQASPNFPHSKPQNNSTFSPLSGPQVPKAHGGSHALHQVHQLHHRGKKPTAAEPRLISIFSPRSFFSFSTSHKAWRDVGTAGASPLGGEAVRGAPGMGNLRSDGIQNFTQNQGFIETWGPWIKSPRNYWVNLGLDCSLMGVPFWGQLIVENPDLRGDMNWWIVHVMEHENQEGSQ